MTTQRNDENIKDGAGRKIKDVDPTLSGCLFLLLI
jgi:hypothetical protein